MEDKGNKRKRYVLAGLFAALAIAFGIDRCADDSPETSQERQTEKTASSADPAGSLRDKSSATDKAPGRQIRTLEGMNSQIHPTNIHALQHSQGLRAVKVIRTIGKTDGKMAFGDSTAAVTAARSEPVPDRQENTPLIPPAVSSEQSLGDSHEDIETTIITSHFPHTHLLRLGIRAGAGYSFISGLGSIVENYNVRPQFTMDEKGGIAPRIGIFGTWRYRRLGAEVGIDYVRLTSRITEYKTPQKVTETTRFHYDLIMPQLLLRFHAFPKFYMGTGISAAIPFGSRHIDFSNDRSGQVYRQQAERTQDHLREAVKPRVLFLPTVKLGYADGKSGLEAGIEYGFGINDLLRTHSNDYGYQERRNNVQYVSLTIGYSLPLNKAR